MRLSTAELEQLGDEHGFGTALSDVEFMWFDGNPSKFVEAAINLEREKLIADLEKQRRGPSDPCGAVLDMIIAIVKEYP